MTKRIAVIGFGQRLTAVLAAMREAGWDFEIAGQADPAPTNGAPVFPSVAALLADGPFDLVMIGSPNHLHYEHLLAAFEAGYPVFAEKPIVRTEAETFALARHLSSAPPLYIGLVMRSMPIVREVIARVDGGELGTIVSMDATEHLPPEHGAYLARNWRRKEEWGGSFLLDKVCHDFDIFGRIAKSRAARVASFGGKTIFASEHASEHEAYNAVDAGWAGANDAFHSDMDVSDHQVVLVEYANGMRLSFHSNSHTSLTERRWYVAGTKGTLIADLVRNRLMVRTAHDRGKPERIDYGGRTADAHNGADQAMARDLLDALEGRAAFPVTPLESLEAGLTVMAVDRAMREGAVVDCAPIWADYDLAVSALK
ncbi:MAG: Gfo/Idh/MocA family oxidoreductase [Alphaproteobacteria bacterium]|nr:Gfo/Idh/MocA family oxidoreductase [Alphaproteobacteria bacterium]